MDFSVLYSASKNQDRHPNYIPAAPAYLSADLYVANGAVIASPVVPFVRKPR